MSRFLKNCCIWNLAGYLKLVFRGPEALWVSQCFIPLSFSSCLENPQWWFLNITYVLHRGLWSLESAEFPLRQNILNSGCMGSLFPGAKDCKSISAAHFFQKETVGVSGNTNLLCPPKQRRQISQSSSWLSEELQEQLLSLATVRFRCLPALTIKRQVSREHRLQAVIRDDGITGALGPPALPYKINGPRTASHYALLPILTQELTDRVRSCNLYFGGHKRWLCSF